MALSFPNRNEPVLACGRSRRAFVKTLTPDPRMEGGTDPHRLPAVAAGGGFVQETPHSLLHGAISHRKARKRYGASVGSGSTEEPYLASNASLMTSQMFVGCLCHQGQ
ncbi:hypothetical protein MTO96_041790 [Rhipicephalus appendiculatus]